MHPSRNVLLKLLTLVVPLIVLWSLQYVSPSAKSLPSTPREETLYKTSTKVEHSFQHNVYSAIITKSTPIEAKPEISTRPLMEAKKLFQVDVFKTPVETCEKNIWYTATVCASDGICQITGQARYQKGRDAPTLKAIKIFNAIGVEIPKKSVHIAWGGDAHQMRYDAFKIFAKVPRHRVKFVSYALPASCSNSTGQDPEPRIPVTFREKTFKDKSVLIITQFYSQVRLAWLVLYFNHYINIGVDYIVLYTTYDPTSELFRRYNEMLKELIRIPMFRDKVIHYDFSKIAPKKAWSNAQATLIGHGTTVFYGATVMSLDLDEIVVPMRNQSLTSIITELSKEHNDWHAHFHSYNLNISEISTDLWNEFRLDYDFSQYVNRAEPCRLNPTIRWMCRSKWISHSWNVEWARIHELGFRRPWSHAYLPYLNESIAILLHMRGVQSSSKLETFSADEEVLKNIRNMEISS